MRFIQQLQQKPKSVKEGWALLVAGSVTGVVVTVWLVAASMRLSDASVRIADRDNAVPEPDAPAFSTMWQQTKQQFAAVAGSVKELAGAGDAEQTAGAQPVSVPATSSTPVPLPNAAGLQLDSTTIETVGGQTSRTAPAAPSPRTVLIGTTSRATSTVE